MKKQELLASVFTDYICPFCYVADSRINRLRTYYDLKVNWCFLEIHPETPPQGLPVCELGYSSQQWKRMMQTLREMAEEEGLSIRDHDYTTSSHSALLLAEAAKGEGPEIFYRLHGRIYEAFFTEGRNIGDRDVLTGIAAESGVSRETVDRAWLEPHYEQRLQQNLMAAREQGIRATPTVFIGNRRLDGAVPVSELMAAARDSRPG